MREKNPEENMAKTFDVIIASDCVYKSDDKLLAHALARVCGEQSLVIITFGTRNSDRKHGEPMTALSW